jgi:hypothetical protein
MIDANKIDRERMDRLLAIARTDVVDVDAAGYRTEVEKTCALLNELALFFLEEIDKDLKGREAFKARCKSVDEVIAKGRDKKP